MRTLNLLCVALAAALVAGCAATPPAATPTSAAAAPVAAAAAEATAEAESPAATPSDVPIPDTPAEPPSASGHATAQLDPNEKICRRRQTTGSRFPETRCQTRAEWIVEEEAARQTTERVQRTRSTPQM